MNDPRIRLSTHLLVEAKKNAETVALMCKRKVLKNYLAEVSNRKQTMILINIRLQDADKLQNHHSDLFQDRKIHI